MTTISSTYAVFANDRTVDYPYVTYEADRIPDDGSESSSEVPGTRTNNWDEAYKMACERSEEERLAHEEEERARNPKVYCGDQMNNGREGLAGSRLCGGCAQTWADRAQNGDDDKYGIGCGVVV